MSPDSETSVERAPEIDELKHFITPFLAAFPNPIVVRAGGAASGGQASGTSVLSWSLRGARRADLYAYPPDGTAQFLGTKTTDGWVRSGPVMLGQTYSWKIFPFRNKTTPYDEEHVTARELDLPAGAGPLGQPHKSENVFYPTNLVSRAAWYAREHSSFVAGPGGLFTSGLGGGRGSDADSG
jgi:hypothetical protein